MLPTHANRHPPPAATPAAVPGSVDLVLSPAPAGMQSAAEPAAAASTSTPGDVALTLPASSHATATQQPADPSSSLHSDPDPDLPSVYDLRSPKQRYVILAVVSVCAILVPFSDTIYLPALQMIQDDFGCSQALVAASVAIYMVMVGVAALVWGPASDRFGRKAAYLVSGLFYEACTIVCIFAPNIGVLVAFRALQGAAVAAYLSTGSSVVSDVFPPEQRGTANGMFMIPILFGPILGPLIGGAVAEAYGWRSTFIALSVLGGLTMPLLFLVLPETHQYMQLAKLDAAQAEAAAHSHGDHGSLAGGQAVPASQPPAAKAPPPPGSLQESASASSSEEEGPAKEQELGTSPRSPPSRGFRESSCILSQPPVFSAPWVPLRFLFEGGIAPHAAVLFVTFSFMFASLTEFPIAVAGAPYNLNSALIGVAYLSVGIAGLVGSPPGGITSDKAAAARPTILEARLVYNAVLTLVLMPTGLLLFGWTLDKGVNLAAPLVGHFIIGVASALYLPALFGYVSTLKQQAAGAATGAAQTTMFISSGIMIEISSVAVQAIGMGPFFTILAGVQVLVNGPVALWTWRKVHAHPRVEVGAPPPAVPAEEAA